MIKKLWPYTQGYRKWIALGVLCSASEAVFELLLPLVMADIVDTGIPAGDTAYILWRGALMVVMALISMSLGIGSAFFSSRAGQGFGANLRRAQYEHIQEYSFQNIEKFSTASLVTRLTNDCNNLQMSLMMAMRLMVRAPVMLISALVLAISISLRLSRVFLVALPLLAVLILLIIRHVSPMFSQLQERTDNVNLVVQENLSAIRVVKSFVREGYEEEKFQARNDALRSVSEKAFGFVVINMPVMMLITYGTIIAVMWYGAPLVQAGELEVGLLSTFFTYITQVLMSLMMVSMIMMMITRTVACAKRVLEVLEEQPDIGDQEANQGLRVADGSIDFDHVSFKYNEAAGKWNLRDIDLHIKSGMTVGIIGATGSAKSTLVQLIPRLYEAQEGTVRVGGRPVKDYTMEHLRDAVSMVLQKNTLFSGTIRENLLWGDENASEADIEAACEAACAAEFIHGLPEGYDTDLGQGGVNVSGGQKQRLCIARAILKNPKVLILDDSTSAVDTATDAKIRQAFRTHLPDTTKIIIAQRIISVMDADLIVVMDDGRIAEAGSHEELMKTSEIYRDVYQSQQEGEHRWLISGETGRATAPMALAVLAALEEASRNQKDIRKTVAKLLGYIGRSKWLLLVVAVCLVLNTLCSVGGSYLLRPLIDECIVPGDYGKLAKMLALMACVYICAALLSYTYSRIMVRVAQKATHAIRRDLFSKMQQLPLSYFDTHTHGELMSRYTNDIDTLTEILQNGVVSLVSGVLTFVGVVAMMLYLSPLLFLVTVFSLGLMLAVVMTVGKRSRRYFMAQQRDLGEVNGYIEEMIEGQKVIKVFNHESKAKEGFARRNEAYRQSATNAQSFAGAMMPAMGNISHINYALTCCLGAVLSIAMGFDLGALVVYLQYTRQVSQPISQVSQQVNSVLAAIAGAERVFEVMETTPEVDEGSVTLIRQGDGWAWKKPDGSTVPLRGDVRFQDVVFRYVPEKTILHGISLYAKPGQKIAFVGSTGAGKTTITNLINRFYEIESGLITYDGIDVRDIRKESLRRSLGIVLQDTHLFTGTIADNIRYGRLDATDEEVRAAAKLANADTFISHLPKGYDTWITGDGGNLSQGERQLLAIARAAVADPPVLILDEATSSIDTRTEKLIEQGMDHLMADRTVFVIAHRLSTVRNARAIMVLEHGEIIERGDHDDLISQGGKYYQLYTGQAELS